MTQQDQINHLHNVVALLQAQIAALEAQISSLSQRIG